MQTKIYVSPSRPKVARIVCLYPLVAANPPICGFPEIKYIHNSTLHYDLVPKVIKYIVGSAPNVQTPRHVTYSTS